MFSTHYHMLLDDFKDRDGVALYHMSYRTNEANDKVMFLYKFIRGSCRMSFGINVARMTGIPRSIYVRAMEKSM